MSPEEKRRDAYYRKNFNIDLAEYNRRFEEQGRACGVCGTPPTNNRLSVEHCHQWRYVKIDTFKGENVGLWFSSAQYWNKGYTSIDEKKNAAIQKLRKILQKASVRGLTCFPCNSAIRSVRNNAEFAQNLANYLKRHQNAN